MFPPGFTAARILVMNPEWINALMGGLLIGLAVSLMLLLNGRVTGISGIIYGLLAPKQKDMAWRLFFIGGLLTGGLALHFLKLTPEFEAPLSTDWNVVLAGLFVGFGTVLGSGCTSGHGVCGISRLSIRSIVATLLFIASGVLSVWVLRSMGVFE